MKCAYCGVEFCGRAMFTIHRDGFCRGPQVPLCDKCGGKIPPSIEDIWAKIANPEPLVEAIKAEQEKANSL